MGGSRQGMLRQRRLDASGGWSGAELAALAAERERLVRLGAGAEARDDGANNAHAHADAVHSDAIASRHSIGLAQGILMERYDVDADRAFAMLAELSMTTNRKLRRVAELVVGRPSGGVPEQLS